jgi:Sulfotransferase family
MTATPARLAPRLAQARQRDGGAGQVTPGGPVIVLTYPYGGVWRLRALLETQPDLACTTGTSLLPLCEHAAAAWRSADGRDSGPLPRLAAVSIRALAASIITTVLARHGKHRWCEIATAPPATAETFLSLYPETTAITLHRAFPDVAYAALHASPWGLSDATFAPFTAAYSGSTAAALAAYWAARTASLLAFEQAHPGQCHRLRYEDLTHSQPPDLPAILGLDRPAGLPQDSRDLDLAAGPLSAADADSTPEDPNRQAPGEGPVPPVPAELIPAPLLAQLNELAAQLGYPPVC